MEGNIHVPYRSGKIQVNFLSKTRHEEATAYELNLLSLHSHVIYRLSVRSSWLQFHEFIGGSGSFSSILAMYSSL